LPHEVVGMTYFFLNKMFVLMFPNCFGSEEC
jgi:hypothetical protein